LKTARRKQNTAFSDRRRRAREPGAYVIEMLHLRGAICIDAEVEERSYRHKANLALTTADDANSRAPK
jgi:hypothetical protein